MGDYIKVKVKNHPYANKNGFYLAHRLVAEAYLGRYLRPEEVVHHINEIKTDNRIENLIVFEDHGAHYTFHNHRRTNYKITQVNRTAHVWIRNYVRDLGIVLYGPSCALVKKRKYKSMAEKTKKQLGLTS